jgi:glycerophosphoryl diester phosphodiesterase
MGYAPENTRASFEEGWRRGADAVECDVHLSRDKEVVVIHDATLDRTTDGRGPVCRQPWAVLKTVDAGGRHSPAFAGERLWRLRDLLAWAKAKKSQDGNPFRVVVEIKGDPAASPGLADRVVGEIRRAGFVRRTIVISFDHSAARRVKRLCPLLQTGLLFSKPPPNLPSRMARAGADAVFPRHNLVDEGFLREARRRGYFVGTWTVNERPEMDRLIRLGVNAIASNFPDRLRGAVDEIQRQGVTDRPSLRGKSLTPGFAGPSPIHGRGNIGERNKPRTLDE